MTQSVIAISRVPHDTSSLVTRHRHPRRKFNWTIFEMPAVSRWMSMPDVSVRCSMFKVVRLERVCELEINDTQFSSEFFVRIISCRHGLRLFHRQRHRRANISHCRCGLDHHP